MKTARRPAPSPSPAARTRRPGATPAFPAAIAALRNLGPRSAQWLAEAGIDTVAKLRRRGALGAYLAMKARQPAVSLNALYALVGALEDRDWREVRRTDRLSLLLQLEDAARPKNGV